MLTCIARSNQPQQIIDHNNNESPPTTKQSLKSITSQIKDIALKASGVYRNCAPCTGSVTQQQQHGIGDSSSATSDRLLPSSSSSSYKRTTSSNSTSTASSRQWGKEMEARLKGISSSTSGGGRTPASASGRRDDPVVFVEESEPKQWVAQVEPGVLITFVSMPRGGNDLKRICFSRDMFNKWQAQRWWAENYEKVMELYNVQRLNRQAFPLPTSSRIEDESSKTDSCEDCPVTPPLSKERLPRTMLKPKGTGLMGYSSSDYDSYNASTTTTPKQYSIINNNYSNGAKIESSTSMDASVRTSSSREADGSAGVSNGSDIVVEREWVEQDESGVYITIRALPGGGKELRRVRFSREKFGEMHARLWWEENRARVHKQYL